ncbi:unnamed protein product [Cochlearia groenlandica]
MEDKGGSKKVICPVALNGINYLLWSRTVKTALGGSHIIKEYEPKTKLKNPKMNHPKKAMKTQRRLFGSKTTKRY